SARRSYELSPFQACFSPPPCRPYALHSFPTRRSSDLFGDGRRWSRAVRGRRSVRVLISLRRRLPTVELQERKGQQGQQQLGQMRSEEHTSELQSLRHLVCRLLLDKKKVEEPGRSAPEP